MQTITEIKDLNLALDIAIKLAVEYHTGQKRDDGLPFITHPLSVMASVNTTEEKIVAVLHDTFEDTALRPQDLFNLGFPFYIVKSIDLLTRREGDDYFSYIEKLSQDQLARTVKIADLQHNLHSITERIAQKDPSRILRYLKALSILRSI